MGNPLEQRVFPYWSCTDSGSSVTLIIDFRLGQSDGHHKWVRQN